MCDIFDAITSDNTPPTQRQLTFIESLCSQLDLKYDDHAPTTKDEASETIKELIQLREVAEYDCGDASVLY